METSKILAGLRHHRDIIHEKNLWADPVALSEQMTKLATYNSLLADKLALLHKKVTDKNWSTFKNITANGIGATIAAQQAKGTSTEEREEYENALNIYRATDNLISVIQSRVRVIGEQIKREGN